MATENYPAYSTNRIAAGYIWKFRNFNLDGITNMGDDWGAVTVRGLSFAIPSSAVHTGTQILAGGRVYSPWATGNQRAPVSYPKYTAKFIMHGAVDAVLFRYTELLNLAGLTAPLYFTFGRHTYTATDYFNYEDYGGKNCMAQLENVTAVFEHTLVRNDWPTYQTTKFEFQCTWQQVGDFSET